MPLPAWFSVMTSLPSPSSATPDAQTVNLAEILLDRGTQSRLGGNDPKTVKRYAEDMVAGLWDFARRPLPVLFFDGDCLGRLLLGICLKVAFLPYNTVTQ